MKLKKLVLTNFRCFKEISIDLFDGEQSNPNLTVFVAGNGHGKTAILDACRYLIGILVGHFPKISVPRLKESDRRRINKYDIVEIFDASLLFSTPYTRLSATTEENITWDITAKRDTSQSTLNQIPDALGHKAILELADKYINIINNEPNEMLPIFCFFGTERAVVRGRPERRRGFQKEFTRYDSYVKTLDGGLDYKKKIEWMEFLEDKQRRERESKRNFDYISIEIATIQLAIERMLPGFRNLRTDTRPLNLVIDVDSQSVYKTCSIDEQLSDGYKIVLVLVLDIVSRMIEANSLITGITAEQLLKTQGIVLIDEVDLHLHPSWQQRIVGDLQTTFPNIQFIVTTHSPQVISAIPGHCVRVLADGHVLNPSIETEGARAEQILNEVFFVASRWNNLPMVKALEEYRSKVSNGTWDDERGLALKKIIYLSYPTDPEVVGLAIETKVQEFKRRMPNETNS